MPFPNTSHTTLPTCSNTGIKGSIFDLISSKLAFNFCIVGDVVLIAALKALKCVTTATTTTIIAAITAITIPAGVLMAAIPTLKALLPAVRPLNPVVAILANLLKLVNAPPIFPTMLTVLPNTIRTGPTAAAIIAHLTICFCCSGSILLNLSSKSVIFSIKGTTAPDKASPTLYLNTSNEAFNCSTAPPGPDIKASDIACDAPVIPSMLSLYPCKASMPGPFMSVIHFPA